MLCSWVNHVTFTVHLSTQEYKGVLVNYQESLMKCWGGGVVMVLPDDSFVYVAMDQI